MSDLQVKLIPAPWNGGLEVFVYNKTINGIAVARSLVMETLPEGYRQANPTFNLGQAEAQELMDGLWQCGFRPSEGSGSAGALAATQRHLDDMRKLVFLGRQDTVLLTGESP